MTSSPEGLLLKPESLHVMEAVRDFRKATGTPVCFTLDAGPNILLIYPQEAKKEVATFINKSLFRFCENGKWIDDSMGKGRKNSDIKLSEAMFPAFESGEKKSFPSKILLLGEYGILTGSAAIATPFPLFSGELCLPPKFENFKETEFVKRSNTQLRALYNFLILSDIPIDF